VTVTVRWPEATVVAEKVMVRRPEATVVVENVVVRRPDTIVLRERSVRATAERSSFAKKSSLDAANDGALRKRGRCEARNVGARASIGRLRASCRRLLPSLAGFSSFDRRIFASSRVASAEAGGTRGTYGRPAPGDRHAAASRRCGAPAWSRAGSAGG